MPLSRYIAFQTQSTFTDETFAAYGANYHPVDPIGEDITGDQQYLYPRTAGIRNIRGRIQGTKKWSGPLDTPLYPTHAVSLLYYGMGSAVTTTNTPVAGVQTHVIKKSNTVPFFRCGIGRDLNEHQYVGGIINSFTVDYSPDEVITASFDAVFRREKSPLAVLNTSAAFPNYDTVERAFGGTEVAVSIGGSVATFVESLSLTWENGVADDAYALGNAHLPAGIISTITSTGSMDLRYDNNARYTDWLAGTTRAIVLNGTYGTGTAQRRLQFNVPVASYDVNRLPTDNRERYVQTLDFTCTPDTNSDPIIVTVVNAQTAAQFTG